MKSPVPDSYTYAGANAPNLIDPSGLAQVRQPASRNLYDNLKKLCQSYMPTKNPPPAGPAPSVPTCPFTDGNCQPNDINSPFGLTIPQQTACDAVLSSARAAARIDRIRDLGCKVAVSCGNCGTADCAGNAGLTWPVRGSTSSVIVICGEGATTDETFRIATPMLKVFWTKCFVGGWGAAYRECFRQASQAAVDANRPGIVVKKSLKMRICDARRVLVDSKHRLKATALDVSACLPVRLRHSGTRIVTKEPRSATAAIRTSPQGRVKIGHMLEWLIGRFRWPLSRRLPSLSASAIARCRLVLLQDQEAPRRSRTAHALKRFQSP